MLFIHSDTLFWIVSKMRQTHSGTWDLPENALLYEAKYPEVWREFASDILAMPPVSGSDFIGSIQF